MNEFFKLLRDFIIFIPLGVLIFGIFFSLISVIKENFTLLIIGLIIVLYGLIASYVRQIYKDILNFLRKEQLGDSDYLRKWKKYHCFYYIVQFLLLGIFVYVLWYFLPLLRANSAPTSLSTMSPGGLVSLNWNALSAIGSILSAVVLAITLYWLVKYTRATEKLAEYQVVPAVEVNMIYDGALKKTYFWFSNASNIPAFVSIKADVKNGKEKREEKVGSLRIPPSNPHYYEFRKTATAFDFLKEDSSGHTEVVLGITVAPAFEKSRIKFHFTKSYRFNKSESQWDETSWSYPDPPFPQKS